jgi:hypothetical protein
MNTAALCPARFDQGSRKSSRERDEKPAIANSIPRDVVLPIFQGAALMQDMLACTEPLEKVVFSTFSSDAALRQHEGGPMPADSGGGGEPAVRTNQSKKGGQAVPGGTAWGDIKTTIQQYAPCICPIARQHGARNSEMMLAAVMILPAQEHTPRGAVTVPGLGDYLEGTCEQQLRPIIIIVRIRPDQPAGCHGVSEREVRISAGRAFGGRGLRDLKPRIILRIPGQ